jgi:hypothetical protein
MAWCLVKHRDNLLFKLLNKRHTHYALFGTQYNLFKAACSSTLLALGWYMSLFSAPLDLSPYLEIDHRKRFPAIARNY